MPKLTATVPLTDPVRFTANGAGLNGGGTPTQKFAVPFVLTNPVRVAADGAQALRLAVPVTAFRTLNLTLQVLLVESPTTVNVAVETAMQNESEDGWQTVDTFTTVVTSPSTSLKAFTGLLRYVRYRVSLNGTTAITLAIQGVAYGSRPGDVQRLYEAESRPTKECTCSCANGGQLQRPRLPGKGLACSSEATRTQQVCDAFQACVSIDGYMDEKGNIHVGPPPFCDGLANMCNHALAAGAACNGIVPFRL